MRGLNGTFSNSVLRVSPLCWFRAFATYAALAAALLMGAADADARAGNALSLGRSGSGTSLPVGTTPQRVALDRSSNPQAGSPAHSSGSLGGLFNRPGLIGGFAAGFLGAGLLGLLFGQGIFGGVSGVASVLGLVFQFALVVMLVRLIWIWWRGGNAPAFAGLSPRQLADAYGTSRADLLPNIGSPAIADIAITESDYDCFERLLGEIKTACNRQDLDALRTRVTPEMLADLSERLARESGRGGDAVGGVTLLRDDRIEAWREGDIDYATVAMRRPPGGRPPQRASQPEQVWTFTRALGRSWLLSAIQKGC